MMTTDPDRKPGRRKPSSRRGVLDPRTPACLSIPELFRAAREGLTAEQAKHVRDCLFCRFGIERAAHQVGGLARPAAVEPSSEDREAGVFRPRHDIAAPTGSPQTMGDPLAVFESADGRRLSLFPGPIAGELTVQFQGALPMTSIGLECAGVHIAWISPIDNHGVGTVPRFDWSTGEIRLLHDNGGPS